MVAAFNLLNHWRVSHHPKWGWHKHIGHHPGPWPTPLGSKSTPRCGATMGYHLFSGRLAMRHFREGMLVGWSKQLRPTTSSISPCSFRVNGASRWFCREKGSTEYKSIQERAPKHTTKWSLWNPKWLPTTKYQNKDHYEPPSKGCLQNRFKNIAPSRCRKCPKQALWDMLKPVFCIEATRNPCYSYNLIYTVLFTKHSGLLKSLGTNCSSTSSRIRCPGTHTRWAIVTSLAIH